MVQSLQAHADAVPHLSARSSESHLEMSGDVILKAESSAGSYRIRRANLGDAPALAELDAKSWPAPLSGLSQPEIEQRIERFELGQLALFDGDNKLVGSLYTQRIASIDQLRHKATFRSVLRLHEPDGRVWQLISVQVDPTLTARGLGDMLINYALTVAKATPGVQAVVAVTRTRGWATAQAKGASTSLEEYARSSVDPGLNFHTGRGAEVVEVVEGWRSEDTANEGCGILIRYDLHQFYLIMGSSSSTYLIQKRSNLFTTHLTVIRSDLQANHAPTTHCHRRLSSIHTTDTPSHHTTIITITTCRQHQHLRHHHHYHNNHDSILHVVLPHATFFPILLH